MKSFGKLFSFSKLEKAWKGLEVITPPKSQNTALNFLSIISVFKGYERIIVQFILSNEWK